MNLPFDVRESFCAERDALRAERDDLAERLAVAESERDGYRLLAVQAIHSLHDAQVDGAQLMERYTRSLDDARGLRVRLLARDGIHEAAA